MIIGRLTFAITALGLVMFLLTGTLRADSPVGLKVPVLLDTDIGGDIDDALALALALSSPEIDLHGITTVDGDAHTRALLVCRLLHAIDRANIPVASGAPLRDPPDYRGQMQYGLRPAFRKRPVKEAAVEFLYARLKANPGELTLCAIGPLTNVAELLTKHPDCKPWIKRIVLMGGSVRVGYNGRPPAEPEWNIKSDIKASRTVFASGVPLVVAPLDATTEVKLEGKEREAVFGTGQPLPNQLRALYQLWDQPAPTLFDPVAIALCIDERFCKMEDLHLEVDDNGLTRAGKGMPNAHVATSIRREDFLKWFVGRIAPGKPIAPVALKATNPSAPVERGMMPNRVHVLENYETDIERRWWLSGQLETKNVPPGSKRACRGVLTNDFDDLQGDPKGMYTAVIFNPVPGPPMGKNTRLNFRCWLKGSDRLRIQIYSLTNGYHRHLTLTKLPQAKWQSLTVDMTRCRRPDGGGGPLSENERIDDIQFYTDAEAELIIDDIILYDAALPGEKRPFPEGPIFTGWFDTGRQGKEWPGDFDIVAHKPPRRWKAARSILDSTSDRPWIRLGLRGERPLNETTRLRFRYHLTGASAMTVSLGGRENPLSDLKKGEWAEKTVEFAVGKGRRASEVRFLLPKGAELFLDDVLLY
ncbi:MAG: nucleoside hydrolase [Planctomycetes bacterium]|nr:nucleoside hydrolase [Planctomycetota bacterium]